MSLFSCLTKFSRQLFLLFERSRAPTFAKRWVIGWWKHYNGLALKEGHKNVNVFAYLATKPFLFLVWNISLLFTALHGRCNYSKNGNQKRHDPSFICCLLWYRTPVAITCHQCGPCWSEILKNWWQDKTDDFYDSSKRIKSLLKWLLSWITTKAS